MHSLWRLHKQILHYWYPLPFDFFVLSSPSFSLNYIEYLLSDVWLQRDRGYDAWTCILCHHKNSARGSYTLTGSYLLYFIFLFPKYVWRMHVSRTGETYIWVCSIQRSPWYHHRNQTSFYFCDRRKHNTKRCSGSSSAFVFPPFYPLPFLF